MTESLDEGGLIEPVVVRHHGHWHRVWRITRLGLMIVLVLAVVAMAALWIWRKPLADDAIRDELAKRGVAATYNLDRVGLRTQEVSNLVIGDPADPDLTARHAVIQMRIMWNGSAEVYRVAARGVRLRGRMLDSGRVSWGEIDKLLPPPSGKPFRLPDLSVDVKDTTIALATPYGPLGFAVEGRGHLLGGFRGRMAVSSSSLRPGACTLEQFRGLVRIGVTARRPQIAGPIGALNFACPDSDIRLAQPRMEINSSFAESFTSFDGRGRLTFSSMEAGVNGLSGVTSNLTFKGTAKDVAGRIDLAARQSRLAEILAQRTRFDGRYRLESGRGALTVLGEYDAAAVALAPTITAPLTGPLQSAQGTPLGPIGRALTAGIRNAARQFDVKGSLRLVNQRGGGAVRIETADVRSNSGARINVAGGDGITYYWPSGRLRIDGDIESSGGGLPAARISLSQPRSGAPMSGQAQIAPMAAGGARLVLGTVRFGAMPSGWTRVETIALVDGPFDGGRVTGLRIPISGRLGPGGALRFGERCVDARFASLSAGALRLGPTRLPFCPDGGAILRRGPGGELGVGAVTRNLRLRGRMGKSPFALDAARARFSGERFSATNVRTRMGRPGTPVLVNAASLGGTLAGGGAQGTFTGGDAIIGRVPLKLSEASGKWRVRSGDLTLDSALTVSDLADPPKFYPLRSNDVRFTLADGRIRATGTLRHPPSGTPVSNVTIAHNLENGNGNAVLDVPGIRFGAGLQPEELTRLTEGVIALVNGTLSGQGRISWDGSGKVSSTGEFTTNDMNLAASFGPVTGMNGTIRFTDLLGLQTAPGQQMLVASINPGILVENGVIRYQLLSDQLVRVERGEWPFMGGRLVLQETILNFGRPSPKRLTFEVVGLDAKTFVDSMGFQELSATGTFDGVLPMIFDDEGGRIVGGRLDSRPGGGTLAYNGVVNRANLGMMGEFAFDALRDLKFRSMIIRLDGYLDGEFATRMTIDGVGLGNTSTQRFIKSINRIPFKFNVTIKGPFRALIATAKSFRDPTKVIEPALPGPLDKIPGVVIETRRHEESQQQSQTPVQQTVTPTPASKP
ncbi:MAG TPA: YdbH domain-containing protein [Sphingomicrobium sp.]|nr:YdbH domain-containing protein [Sphingomicrobium sp.]